MNVYDGDGRKKTPKKNEKTKPRKRFSPFWLPFPPPSTKLEADCFSVSENTANKPDLPWGGGS